VIDAVHNYVLHGVDAAGNVSAASPTLAVTVDTVAPAVPAAPDLQAASDSGVSAADDVTNDDTPTLDIATTDAYYRLERNGAQISSDYATVATFTDSSRPDGIYQYAARAVDAAGNASALGSAARRRH
jgi:hypothetical protein